MEYDLSVKQRMTVSLTAAVVDEAERLGSRRGLRSRSAVVERALRELVRKLRAEDIATDLDAYYRTQTAEEAGEEAAMVQAFQRTRRRDDLDGRPPGRRARAK